MIAASRVRRSRPLRGRDAAVSIVLGGGFLAAAVGLELAAPAQVPLRTGLVLLALYWAASSVEFEIGEGVALAGELAIVPMFLLLPPAGVPLLVAAAELARRSGDLLTRRLHPTRAFVLLGSCWYTVGPALVLTAAGARGPTWSNAPLYLGAFAAQLGGDLASSVAREVWALGCRLRRTARSLGWAYLVDTLLAPAGLLAAFAAADRPEVLLLLVFPCSLLALLARDRRRRIDDALGLSRRFDHAQRQATEDALTGLANRRAWDHAVAAAALADHPHAGSVVIVDLDGLKEANDTHGHDVGDRLISELAVLLTHAVGSRGLVARIGGDEMGVLLLDTEELGCQALVREIRDRLHRHPGADGVELLASIGHASSPPAADLREALRLADARMYMDKRARQHPLAAGAPAG